MRQKYIFCCVWSRKQWKIIATRSSYFIWLNKHGGVIIIRWTQVVTKVLLESGKCCWSSTTMESWIWYTTNNKGNNNKNPRQIWSQWNGVTCVEKSVQKPLLNDLFGKINMRFTSIRRGPTSLSCQCEKFSLLIDFPFNVYDIGHIQSEMDRTKRKCYWVPTSISRFNPSRFLPLGEL